MPGQSGTVELHRILRATPDLVYKAFVDASALERWLPPFGFTGKVDKIDVEVGGGYHMSFTNFASGSIHSFSAKFTELIRNQRIRHTDRFDNPELPGEMDVLINLKAVSCGTEITIVQEGIPQVIPVENCYLGWQESLTMLAKLVEPNIPDDGH